MYTFEEISPVGCSPVLYNEFSIYRSWDEGIGPLGIAPRTTKRMWLLLYMTEANVNVNDKQTNFTPLSVLPKEQELIPESLNIE